MGTVPSPYVPVAGDDATQARVLTWADAANYLLGNATSGGSKRPLTILRQTVVQSLANNTGAAILFDTEDVDYDGSHSTSVSTSRFTAVTAGLHHVDFTASFAVSATGFRVAYLRKNTTDQAPRAAIAAATGTATGVTGSAFVSLAVGDFLELWVVQNSGGALNTSIALPDQSYMAVEWRSN